MTTSGRPIPMLAPTALLASLVVGAILLVGGCGASPTPSATATPTPPTVTPTTSPSSPVSDPESAVRAFFEALKEARRTDDAAAIRPFVTGEQSGAYLSVQGFVEGQRAAEKASVLTVQELDDVRVEVNGDTATVRLTYTEGGYDIGLDDGQPLESPMVLAPRAVTVELRLVDGRWLVDNYDARAQ